MHPLASLIIGIALGTHLGAQSAVFFFPLAMMWYVAANYGDNLTDAAKKCWERLKVPAKIEWNLTVQHTRRNCAGSLLLINKFKGIISHPSIAAVVGKRGCEKAHLMHDLCHSWQEKVRGSSVRIIVVASDDCDRDGWKAMLGCNYSDKTVSGKEREVYVSRQHQIEIYSDFDAGAIASLRHVRQFNKKGESAGVDKVLLILDDLNVVGSETKTESKSEIETVFADHKANNTHILFYSQHAPVLSDAARGQIDYCFAFEEPNVLLRTRLWMTFFGIFPFFHGFSSIMSACMLPGQALVIDNTVKSNRAEDRVFWHQVGTSPYAIELAGPCGCTGVLL